MQTTPLYCGTTLSSQALNACKGMPFLVGDTTDRLKMSTPRPRAASSFWMKSASSALPATLKMFPT
jgi:hypothetical protein